MDRNKVLLFDSGSDSVGSSTGALDFLVEEKVAQAEVAEGNGAAPVVESGDVAEFLDDSDPLSFAVVCKGDPQRWVPEFIPPLLLLL